MSIFRAVNGGGNLRDHGRRIQTSNAGFFDFESEVLQDDEYAWSWGMAHAFREAFEKKFSIHVELCAKYKANLLGLCRHYGGDHYAIELRPTLRGNEAWRTFFHELAHAITPRQVENDHGKEWMEKLTIVHDFWKGFLKGLEGDSKTRLIEMVMNYGYWRGRPIGMDENTDPWNRPWAKR